MTGRTELGYWMKDDSWYDYNEEKDIFELTDKAPERARRSFEKWKVWNQKTKESHAY